MSAESLAALRSSRPELAKLAEEHLQHDLRQSDRDALQSASSTIGTYTYVGTAVGLGLGLWLAYRLRSARTAYFNAFKTAKKPTQISFADGTTEALPDLTPFVKPTPFGDFAAYTFLGLGGIFIGGELGLMGGLVGAQSSISKDPESRKRIENAFRRYRADVLRKEIEELEKGTQELDVLGSW